MRQFDVNQVLLVLGILLAIFLAAMVIWKYTNQKRQAMEAPIGYDNPLYSSDVSYV
eukprot:m.89529 g.89529  ORF g.89529 m.89529 type:complete len:56 (-) comp13226_c0_seq5:151-318(-)